MKKLLPLFLLGVLSVLLTSCEGISKIHDSTQNNQGIILNNDNVDEDHNHVLRNALLKEDVEFFTTKFPEKHKNLFHTMSSDDFVKRTRELTENIGDLSNLEVFASLASITASVGDAHTTMPYWDGAIYPLRFYMFDGEVYIVNAEKSLEDMMYSKVLKINGVDIDEIINSLTTIISHENEFWVQAMLPEYLRAPIYLHSLGFVINQIHGINEQISIFTIEKDGVVRDYTVPVLSVKDYINYCVDDENNVVIGRFNKLYEYYLLEDKKALYFRYNSCLNMDGISFKDFVTQMFSELKPGDVDKIVIDLRNNSGGNSTVITPLFMNLNNYLVDNRAIHNINTSVFILVGRQTFSSGVMAVFDILSLVPEAITVGESTGGAIDGYGEVMTFQLPNSLLTVNYSTKFFELSSSYNLEKDRTDTLEPDVIIIPTFDDFIEGKDIVLDYALQN